MANLIYPAGSGITTVVNTDLENDDMTFVGMSIAGAAQQTDYSDIKAGIIGNPGALGGVLGASSIAATNSSEATGAMTIKSSTASSGTLAGATDKIEVDVPSGALLLACQLRVDVLVVNDGDDTWSAAFSGGATQSICAGSAPAKNTKINTFFDANAATPITSAETDITLTPQAANFTAGEITAVVYYIELTSLDDAA